MFIPKNSLWIFLHIINFHVFFVPLPYKKRGAVSIDPVKDSLVTLGPTKKFCIHAAMIVPCRTLRARAEVPPLKDCLNLKQSCSAHRESVVRFNGCESFGSTRSACQNRSTVEMVKFSIVKLVRCSKVGKLCSPARMVHQTNPMGEIMKLALVTLVKRFMVRIGDL